MRLEWKIVALAAAVSFPTAATAGPTVVSAMENVFPTGTIDGGAEARIDAASGEWEAFQVVVRGPLSGVRATARVDGLPAPLLYRVAYLEVKTPSSSEGRPGLWPDALVPDVDAFVGEKRNAFPFDVPAGEQRA